MRLFERVYTRIGLQFSYAPAGDLEAFIGEIRPSTRLIWLETPTNPLLNLCDIGAISRRLGHPATLP
jgi:cystathionine beta-lyase/cystathionine gamma-synthase